MDLTKYYPDIVAKYPAYVTKRELCEICHICPKTAYNLEQQGEIPYTIEQNHLIRSHKIKLTDILAYLYRRECRQEADSPYICAMRTFYDEHLSPYSDLLSVKDIQQITGFSSSAIVRWISTGILKAFQPGKQYTVPKDFIKTIAAKCGYGVSTVKRALDELVKAGYIVKQARFDERKNGGQTSNLYTLCSDLLCPDEPENAPVLEDDASDESPAVQPESAPADACNASDPTPGEQSATLPTADSYSFADGFETKIGRQFCRPIRMWTGGQSIFIPP